MTLSKQDTINKRLTAARATLSQTQQRVSAVQANLYTADLRAFTVPAPVKPLRWRFWRPPEIGRPDTLGPVLDPTATRRVMKAWRAASRHLTRRVAHFTAKVQERADQLTAARQLDIERLYSPIVNALRQIELQLPPRKRK
jgi:hypothetical protein